VIPGIITPERTRASDGAIPIRPIKHGTSKSDGEPRSGLAKNVNANINNARQPNNADERTNADVLNKTDHKSHLGCGNSSPCSSLTAFL
jgi:hypothetical protein